MYQVAGPSESLAITDREIPIQVYTFEVHVTSADKNLFILLPDFTIGPLVNDHESMIKFEAMINTLVISEQSNDVNKIIQRVIEKVISTAAASMTTEEIFKGTKEFKQAVIDKVQVNLDKFGLHIYKANVKQLVDVPGNEYISNLGQKTQMEAANHARETQREAEAAVHLKKQNDASGGDSRMNGVTVNGSRIVALCQAVYK